MDYSKVLEDAQRELDEKKQRKAVLEQQIKDLASQYSLDMSQPLLPQIETLEAKFKAEQEEVEKNIESLQEQLKSC